MTEESGSDGAAGLPLLRALLQAEFARNDAQSVELAQWLHDDVAQMLVAAGLALAGEEPAPESRCALQDELARLGREVRNRSRALVPPAAAHLEPVSALAAVAADMAERRGLTAAIATEGTGMRPAPRVVLAVADVLGRILDEAPPQGSPSVAIEIRAQPDWLTVRVELPLPEVERWALTLAFAAERVRPFGETEWSPRHDGGALVIRASLKERSR